MLIKAEKLSYTYMPGTPFASQALKGVTFSLEEGGFTLLLGPSGSGKSTLIQHLNGLLLPSSGMITIQGKVVGQSKKELLMLRRKIGLVFQMPEDQFFSETVYDEVAFAPRNLGLDEREVKARVTEALKRVGLDHDKLGFRHPFHLSSGQKRLVAIAAVLSLNPEVLVMDEPTAGLDPAGREKLFSLLKDLNLRDGMAIVVSTHHFEEIADLADKVLVLSGGSVVMNGSPGEVFSRKEELEALGLSVPAGADFMNRLFKCGIPVRSGLFSLEAVRSEINRLREVFQS